MKNKLKRILKIANLWQCFAKVVPMAFLGFLFLFYHLGFDDAIERGIVIGGTVFFATAVLWWWWAIDKIVFLTNLLYDALDKLTSVKQDLDGVTKDLKNDSLGQRRESEEN